ncbi:hypothetical protein PG985_015835 [Apiospora marii]|uniref:uncharacterized protein n=1 Tax=Apiospora marii TaxID=335849 RepID=UPI003131EF1B
MVFERPTVFGSMLESELPERGKDTSQLANEAFGIPSWNANDELGTIGDNLPLAGQASPSLTDLTCWLHANYSEKIPVLGFGIQEGLRLSYGVTRRTARVATREAPSYRGEWKKKPVDYTIPKGYAIGMPTVITHHGENDFPSSHDFVLEH